MNVLKRQNGFSLVEALMILGITSIIGLAVMQTMKDSTNNMALSEAKFEQLELIRQIQTNLIFKPSCEANLKNRVVDNLTIADITELLDSNLKPILQKDTKVGNNSLMVRDFSFTISQQQLDAFNAFKAAPTSPTFMMDMQFYIKTEKLKTNMGGKFLTRSIPIKVKVDTTSSTIQECFAANDAGNFTAMSNFCAQMGGTFNETTSLCNFNQDCAKTTGAQLIPAKCVDEKMEALMASFTKQMADLAATRTVASADPVASPSPTPVDKYKLPFSYANPGKGCKGTYCAASDFGPCDGIGCTTNGGSCLGTNCRTGVVTGTVAYDGTNMFTPANPGPGCKGTYCHANDYGPCDGIGCTTNGGSCTGTSCATGITN